MKPSTEWWRYLAPLAVIAIIALLPLPAGLESHTWLYFAVFTGVIVGLILEPVPGAVVAMVGISIIAILSPWLLFSPEQLAQPGFKFTAKSLSWAVSGFSNSVIWLIFAAFMFGTGYEKTGLGRRIALILVKKMGHRTLFLGYAVMFSELILAPVTPSNSARGAGIIYPIIRNLPPLYQSQPNDSSSRSIGSYIMWMGIVADCVTSAIFLTAMAPNLLLIGLMKSASHADHAKLGRLVPRDVAAQHFTGFAGSLAGLRAVPAGTEVWRSGAALGRDGTAGNGPALFA
ncbi:hypothetical protein EIMP300_21730 [Escherichia coli]|uniref:Tartrate carrier protein n=1 Tax=Escherichia coli TaxID=562 RepID=A0A8S0FKP0_ECOLX|nr:hypothetical protein EIMP300_21730 [Escherichia coli]